MNATAVSHHRPQVPPLAWASFPTSLHCHGMVQLSPAKAQLRQHEGTWCQDGKLVHRGERGNWVTALHFWRYHCDKLIFKWNHFGLNMRAGMLYFLTFPGLFPYISRHSLLQLQSMFSVVSRHSSQSTLLLHKMKTPVFHGKQVWQFSSNGQVSKLYLLGSYEALLFFRWFLEFGLSSYQAGWGVDSMAFPDFVKGSNLHDGSLRLGRETDFLSDYPSTCPALTERRQAIMWPLKVLSKSCA